MCLKQLERGQDVVGVGVELRWRVIMANQAFTQGRPLFRGRPPSDLGDLDGLVGPNLAMIV